mmetsp:Transcript_14776/g.41172  ORF Transcript_14776/g.41172 Transcript_14776/m.41172 type:complete len:196 (-) Transcript_14776:843-1430(-)
MTNKRNILYVNLIVQNVSEAVKEKVTTKLERTKLLPNVVVAQAAHTASEFASPKYVTIKLSDQLCKKIPGGLKKNGIDTMMNEVFRENTFAVLQLSVINVDPIVLASTSESAWTERGLSCFLDCIGTSNRKFVEEDYREYLSLWSILLSTSNSSYLILFIITCGSSHHFKTSNSPKNSDSNARFHDAPNNSRDSF